ncbi:MAG: GIY-YIG nuclease family protein [Lachnospiraceae bacterium]|nr:GIY-YIG nuclease family protein [Lachnospiraceae bacterium]
MCEDGSLYTGSTNDIKLRFNKHQSGKGAKYTRSHPPVEIVYQEEFPSKRKALQREIEIKKMSRSKKLELVRLNEKMGN